MLATNALILITPRTKETIFGSTGAQIGKPEACVRDGFIRRSLTAYKGYLTHEETSGIQGRPWIRPEDILGIADRKLDPAPPATTTKSNNFITCCK